MPYLGKQPANVPVTAEDIPDNSITAAKIIDGAITIADIANDAVTEDKLANSINTAIAANTAKTGITSSQASAITANTAKTGITSGQASAIVANTAKTGISSGQTSAITANTAKVTNATHTGDVTGATALTIAAGAVDIAMLSATGTAGSGNFLRGDNSWATAGSTSASDLTSGTLPIARIADDAVTADKLANSINTDIATGVTANTTANAALPKAGGTLTGDLNFGDNVDANFGAGADLKIYHTGDDSFISEEGSGNLYINSTNTVIRGNGTENAAKFLGNAGVELYHDNTKKFETTATGVTVTGDITTAADGKLQSTSGYMQVIAEDTLYLKCDSDNAGGESIHFIHGTTTLCKMQENGVSLFGTGVVTPSQNGIITIGSQGTTPLLELKVSHTSAYGAVKFQNDNGEVGSIGVSANATNYATSSDYRLKENVDYTWDATTRLKQLKPARFNFIADDTNTLVDGFLAHEAATVVPECVVGTKDQVQTWTAEELLPDGVSAGDNKLDDDGNTIPQMQGIDQSKLVPLLVKTIQELEARITALEA